MKTFVSNGVRVGKPRPHHKGKRLHKKIAQLPQDWIETPTWPQFHCFGTPIWPS